MQVNIKDKRSIIKFNKRLKKFKFPFFFGSKYMSGLRPNFNTLRYLLTFEENVRFSILFI